MKGVIVNCLGELVKEKFGNDKWEEALEKTGLNRESHFLASQDVDDSIALKAVESVCKILNISLTQAADAFGDYWVNVFAPRIYSVFYKASHSAREFLLKMDNVHKNVTENMENARPPRFDYEWKDDNTLIMKYKSHRGLIDFLVGLIKGVGKHYNEDLSVRKLGSDSVEIVFPG